MKKGPGVGCVCNVANGSRHVRHASAIRVFMVGIQREDWLRARNAQFVRLSSICGNECGDTCGMARCCVQAARQGIVPVLPEEDVERLDAAEAIEKMACEGRDWQDVGSVVSACPTVCGSWML